MRVLLRYINLIFVAYLFLKVTGIITDESEHMCSLLQERFLENDLEYIEQYSENERMGKFKEILYKRASLGRKGFSILEETINLLILSSFLLIINFIFLKQKKAITTPLEKPSTNT